MRTRRTSQPINEPSPRPANSRHRRGTIIVLVVAVLGLLAVIGTAYILAARTDKANSSAGNTTYNLELARAAFMNQFLQAAGNAVIGADGNVGSYAITGAFGNQPARLYDYPDVNLEPWLVDHLHPQPTDVNKYSTLTASAFNPSNGTYSLGLQLFPYNSAPYMGTLSTVVGDQTTIDATTDDRPSGVADSYINLLPFSDASGNRYRYGWRILDTSRMANLNVGSTDDSQSTGDIAGSWLTAMRLAPASGMPVNNAYFNTNDNPAYLHASQAPSFLGRSSSMSTGGNITFSVSNWMQQVLRFERPTDLGITPFELCDELELRSYGEFGTQYHIRAATGDGNPYTCWPNTLSGDQNKTTPSAVVQGNPRRRNYTFYSESRKLRPYPDPAFRYFLNPSDGKGGPSGYPAGNPIWPVLPACIAASPNTPTPSSNDAMFYTAMAATNIATIMEYSCGTPNSDGSANPNFPSGPVSYTHEEACAFAANYCTAKWNGFTPDLNFPGKNAYFLPAGPSFVDPLGICIRGATSATTPFHREFGSGVPTDLHTLNNQVFLGYSAQPFVAEVAAYEADDDTGDGTTPATPPYTVVKDAAIELYNPYPVALSLKGYHLKDTGSIDIALTGYIPANGYYIITSPGGYFFSKLNGTAPVQNGTAQVQTDGSFVVTPNSQMFVLYRPYYDRGFTAQLAPVDQFNVTRLVALPGTGVALPAQSVKGKNFFAEFNLHRAGPVWGPAIDNVVDRTIGQELGADSWPVGTAYPLPDRYAYPTQGKQGDPLGMGEFARIMRIAHEFSPNASAPYTGLIPDHLVTISNSPGVPYTGMIMTTSGSGTDKVDAQILFDFYGDPHYYPVAGGAPVDPNGNNGVHDVRAVRLFDQIAMIDRVSEFDIDIGGGATDINKIRIPGQINVNTASGDVLRAIPNINDQMVANILGYRARVVHSDPRAQYNGTQANTDFNNVSIYPGTGIRSISELAVPLANTAAATLDQRDMLWGSIANYCTVRSDTFVVYGYLEAVKVNPSYTGVHDNGASWYGAVIDSPTAVGANNIPNLRVAHRRWVAIVDRSYCNVSPKIDPQHFTLPRVVAIKDLPE